MTLDDVAPNNNTGSSGSPSAREGATIVAQLRVRPDAQDAFAHWEAEVNTVLSSWPGFIQQTAIPPSPPVEARWTIFQWFEQDAAAFDWLASPQRHQLLKAAQAILIGSDDVHVARARGQPQAAVSASTIIETHVKPSMESAYRAWQHRIGAALSAAPGFQSYRFEPPLPGVRDSWLVLIRFDTQAALDAWLECTERRRLLRDVEALTSDRSERTVGSSFEQWFPETPGEVPPASWKMNMIVLAVLYPTVFLIDTFVAFPLLGVGIPSWLAIFFGNVACVLILSLLVPRISRYLGWWLNPVARGNLRRINWLGIATMMVAYGASLAIFAAYAAIKP